MARELEDLFAMPSQEWVKNGTGRAVTRIIDQLNDVGAFIHLSKFCDGELRARGYRTRQFVDIFADVIPGSEQLYIAAQLPIQEVYFNKKAIDIPHHIQINTEYVFGKGNSEILLLDVDSQTLSVRSGSRIGGKISTKNVAQIIFAGNKEDNFRAFPDAIWNGFVKSNYARM